MASSYNAIVILFMLPIFSALLPPSRLILLRHCHPRSGHRLIPHSLGGSWSSSSSSIHSTKTGLLSLMKDTILSTSEDTKQHQQHYYSGNKHTMEGADDDDDASNDEDFDIDNELLQEEEESSLHTGTGTGTDTKAVDSPYRAEYQDLFSKFTAVVGGHITLTSLDTLPKGIPDGFYIVQSGTIPDTGFTQAQLDDTFSKNDIDRLKLQPDNVTVPAALLLLFPNQFATRTRATKEVRKRKILVHHGPLITTCCGTDTDDEEGGEGRRMQEARRMFDTTRMTVAKAADRVRPGDTLAIQTRMTHNYAECQVHDKHPPFHLPVVYEDDHFAIVNKPEGIVVFSHKGGGFGRDSVKACLPWTLTPPTVGVMSVMRRPCPVHRIDRGTSGLLVCAKTKPAMVELARMFKERKVKKTYTAIVNGDIQEPVATSITSKEAESQGVCIGNDEKVTHWQIIDKELDDRSAITIWRVVRKMKLVNARNDTVSLVELKPKTGRYHQLRRHMAWVSNCPLLGDKLYDGGGLAKTLRDQGFYLCSNRVTLEHPFYNTPQGKSEWAAKREDILGMKKDCNDVHITEEEGVVWVYCKINLPVKFKDLETGVNSKDNRM